MKGEKLKALLQERGMTQNEFAELLGTNKSNVSKMMRRNDMNPKESTIKKICEILGVDPSEIMDQIMNIDWKIPDKCQKLEPPEEENPDWCEIYEAAFPIINRKVDVYDKDEAIRQLKLTIEDIEETISIIEDCD